MNFLDDDFPAFFLVTATCSSGRDVRILKIRIGTSPNETDSTLRRLMTDCVFRKSSKMNYTLSRMIPLIMGSRAFGQSLTMALLSQAAVSPIVYWSSSTTSSLLR